MTFPSPSPRSAGSRTPLIIGLVCALLLVLALVIGAIGIGTFLMLRSGSSPEPATPTGDQGASLTIEEPFLGFGSDSSGPVVDVYIDFSCPHCADFAEVNDDDLRRLAEADEIDLRIHPRPMLDLASAGYSARAANAAACVYAEDPALYWDMSAALFDVQADGAAQDDHDIALMAEGIGAGTETQDCITSGAATGWVHDTVEPEALERASGTPTVLIDGEQWTGDHTVDGELSGAITGG